ncbi:MAG TPA: hypothetical protein ENN40_11935 [Candidatus Aminicenantes bacterium]|nr:hypothetical protein [Candidatus Aminicenantes bacterium]
MDLTVGLVLFVGFLIVQMVGRRRKIRPFGHYRPFLSMAAAAFMVGFAGFMLFTFRVPSIAQKIAVALVALTLAAVNILVSEGREKAPK